jgi:Cu/Zn superoxide dismutase
MRRCPAIVALGLACSIAGCASTRDEWDARLSTGLVAQLSSPSSAVKGVVRVYDYKDGVQVQMSVNNMIPGSYRVAFHERNNCRSPNLFSAGPAWAPPSWTKPAADLLPGFLANDEGSQTGYVAFVKGVSIDGPESLRMRSVVIHWGNLVGEAFPGQPNNRMACGVFETPKPLI